jgi:hypothetical protein
MPPFNTSDYLQQATMGGMGGIQPAQQPQQNMQFDPRVMEALGLSQGYDQEDERLMRQRALVAALRKQSQAPVDAPKSSGAWAQGLANVANAGMAAWKDRKTDAAQRAADQARMQGSRDFSILHRGAEGQQPDGSLRVPFSPMRRY